MKKHFINTHINPTYENISLGQVILYIWLFCESCSDSDCIEILQSLNSIVKKNNPQLTLSKVLGCKFINI